MLTILQKAACEAIWRAHKEREESLIDIPLPLDEAHCRRHIEGFVALCRLDELARITLPEIENHGRLRGGYAIRWGTGAAVDPAPPMPDMIVFEENEMSKPD